MRKRILFLLLLQPSILSPVLAQKYKVRTIFELLKVPNVKKPLNISVTKFEAVDIAEEDKIGFLKPDGADLVGDGILQALLPLVEWLKLHPAGTKNKIEETVTKLKGPALRYDSRLQFKGSDFRIITSSGESKDLGKLFYIPAGDHANGLNVIDKEKGNRYYDNYGRLIFDNKFQYVEKEEDGLYRFFKGNKNGIADSTGKILLPAEYDQAHSFFFNKKLWFSVSKDKKIYYIESGSTKPFMINPTADAGYLPKIVANRYWIIRGRVYDMLKKEELFSSIKTSIHASNNDYPVFHIVRDIDLPKGEEVAPGLLDGKEDDGEEVYFDANGNLLMGQPLRGSDGLSDTTTFVKIFNKDTLVNGKKYAMHFYGIMHDNGTWLKKPVYPHMRIIDKEESNMVMFITRPWWISGKPGLMDAGGNIVIPEGKYIGFEDGGLPGKFVCYTRDQTELWDMKTNSFSPLDKHFFFIQHYGKLENMGLMVGRTTSNRSYLLNANYQLLDTTGWADISADLDEDNLIEFFPLVKGERDYYGERIITDRELKRISFTFNGKTYDTFMGVDSLAPGSYFYQRKDGKNIVRVKEGQYFMTNCEYMSYDPFYNWYIGRSKQNGVGILDETGKELLPFSFSGIGKYSSFYGTAKLEYGEDKVQQLDKDGHILFENKYDKVTPITFNFFIVEKNGVKGILNRSGKEILPVTQHYLNIDKGIIWYGSEEKLAKSMAISSLQGRE